MAWLVVGVWIGAVLLAAAVLGFGVYELSWKIRRLRTDLTRLAALAGPLGDLQVELAEVQRRALAVAEVRG